MNIQKNNNRVVWRLCLSIFLVSLSSLGFSQIFTHPGIDQTPDDLAFMKRQVLAGKEPWASAFQQLRSNTKLDFVNRPHVHVVRGPYGRPDIGGSDLSTGASVAYDCALIWYVTGEQEYADKAIEIVNGWSKTLWHFDNNDAKLIAGYTGYVFCNAAEILRYSDSGWDVEDIRAFSDMLMNVYYPLLRYYYPQANGNWDGAIIHSLMAIAIFTDNRRIFDSAINHFLYGSINGSVFRYIYPSGQSQESTRDQAHVQFGQSEFAGAARIAYSQGKDLFSAGDQRIAKGYEYTAKFILESDTPQAYGTISHERKEIRYEYEHIYQHYTAKGFKMPYSALAALKLRSTNPRSVLTATRDSYKSTGAVREIPISNFGYPAGASADVQLPVTTRAKYVKPGESLQKALEEVAGTGQWVIAEAGIHTLPETLKIPSGVTLSGRGINTILFLDPKSKDRDAITNASSDLSDVTIRNMVIESSLVTGTPANSRRSFNNIGRRSGIVLVSDQKGKMNRIKLLNLTVRNSVYSGVTIKGGAGIEVVNCDISENGADMVPGVHLLHNIHFSHCQDIKVRACRLDTSPKGSGLTIAHSQNVRVENCEIARNGYFGLLVTESNNVGVNGSLIEANGQSGVMIEFLSRGSEHLTFSGNKIQYNDGYGIEAYASRKLSLVRNVFTGNRLSLSHIVDQPTILVP